MASAKTVADIIDRVPEGGMLTDVASAQEVELQIDRGIVRINVDGICIFRTMKVDRVVLEENGITAFVTKTFKS